jgi:hypothetical protein
MACSATTPIQHKLSSVIAAVTGIAVGALAVPSAQAGGNPPPNSALPPCPMATGRT